MLTSLPPDSELLHLQTHFTQHLRNPELVPLPQGLDSRRMGIYSDLIFHNISALMSEFFPVIYRMTDATDWGNLIREFFIKHRAETPYFPRLAEEFLHFLMARPGTNHEPDYLLPLAHYEWLELYLFTLEVELPSESIPESQLVLQPLKLSELAIPLVYEFPVHQIKPGWVESRVATHLLLFRDAADNVKFCELQPLAYQLLNAMQNTSGVIVTEWLASKAAVLKETETKFVEFGLQLIQQFNREKLLYV